MSTQSLVTQALPFSHAERPNIQDLFTLDLSGSNLWYQLGIELGLNLATLEGIKAKHSKPQACKRAMFKEWLSVCPAESCTWSHLIQALTKVDPEAAKVVSKTIDFNPKEASPKLGQPHTAQFPLASESKAEGGRIATTSTPLSMTSLPPSLSIGGKERPQTEIMRVRDPSSSLTFPATTGQRLPTSSSKTSGRVESDYAPPSIHSDDIIHEAESSSNHMSSRSFSPEEYHTASEDESIQPFSYQQDAEQSSTFSASTDPVSTIKASLSLSIHSH